MSHRRRGSRWLLVPVALAAAAAAFALWQWATWPDVARLAQANPETTAFIERWRERERAAGRAGKPEWRPVPYARIADDLKVAVLVGEDIDFFSHDGFATHEMKQALETAWEEKQLPRGASTITQQLAKNLWLSPSRNPWRKVKEALLTRSLERHLSKRRILELYLNVVELGPGVYGAEAAARHWFGKSAAALDRRAAAELAASLPRPSTWHPGSASRGYARSVERILGRIERATWLRREI
ncbi:MAG: transglycosylase domain-containing protein [Acidobacteria bacterium]|nr:transglycosylase domain-containing protein [Acidobacteriota bacterium]